jgi:hypothetical protein
MQANEGLKPPIPEAPKVSKTPEFGEKLKSNMEKLKTYVGDFGRDIATANEMARDKFGDTAIGNAEKGVLPTLFGLAAEHLLSDVLDKGLKTGDIRFNRTFLPLNRETITKLQELRKRNPNMYYFIESAVKDVVIGLTYNGIAHFSGRALDPAEAKHFVGSLVISALDALGPNGKGEVQQDMSKPPQKFIQQERRNLEIQRTERDAAYQKVPWPPEAVENARKQGLMQLRNQQKDIEKQWIDADHANELWAQFVESKKHAFQDQHGQKEIPEGLRQRWVKQFIEKYGSFDPRVVGKTKEELRLEILPPKISNSIFKAESQKNDQAAEKEGKAVQRRLKRAAVALLRAYKNLEEFDAKYPFTAESVKEPYSLKKEALALVKYSNPPVLKGLDVIITSMNELRLNYEEVRKVRKEKGGMPGQKVEMSSKRDWQDRGNRNQIRYGNSNWRDRKS